MWMICIYWWKIFKLKYVDWLILNMKWKYFLGNVVLWIKKKVLLVMSVCELFVLIGKLKKKGFVVFIFRMNKICLKKIKYVCFICWKILW